MNKKIGILFFIFFPVFLLPAQTELFGSFRIGSSGPDAERFIINEYRNFYTVSTAGGVKTYMISLNENTVSEIILAERIESVKLTYERVSLRDYIDILDQVYALYGEPYYSEYSEGEFRFLWYDQQTDITCVTYVSITAGRDFSVEVSAREKNSRN